MVLTRFDPFRDLARLQNRMNRLFDDAHLAGRDDDVLSGGTWLPPVDVYEQEGALVLKAELPGMTKDAIDVSVENTTLTVRGERTMDTDVKQDNVHRIERSYGGFSRSFALTSKVDTSRIAADYKDGVLTITLPLREEAKPRSIAVNVA